MHMWILIRNKLMNFLYLLSDLIGLIVRYCVEFDSLSQSLCTLPNHRLIGINETWVWIQNYSLKLLFFNCCSYCDSNYETYEKNSWKRQNCPQNTSLAFCASKKAARLNLFIKNYFLHFNESNFFDVSKFRIKHVSKKYFLRIEK